MFILKNLWAHSNKIFELSIVFSDKSRKTYEIVNSFP